MHEAMSGFQPLEGTKGTSTCVCHPDHPWKANWDVVIMGLILYSAVAVPVHIGFDTAASGWLWSFEALSSILFVTDLVLNFRTGFFEEGQLVVDPRRIAIRYCSAWFWIDAPSSLPVELIEVALPPNEGSARSHLTLLRFLRVFRLVRLLRLLKISTYVARLEDAFDVNLKSLRVVGLVLNMMFISHILACAFYYVGSASAEASADGDTSWVEEWAIYSTPQAAVPLERKYLFSIYWALTTLTTVGYGDITPQNDIERRFVTVALLLGSLVFAYILGVIASLLQTYDRQSMLVGERIDAVKDYSRFRSLPRELSVRVRRYYEHYYTQRPIFDEASILETLNPQLKMEVVQRCLAGTLGKLPLFNTLDPDFRMAIFPKLKPQSFDPGEVIFRRGYPSNELLFLLEGEVKVLSSSDEATPIRIIRRNEEAIICAVREEINVEGVGCFGQTVLLGRRRRFTHVASMPASVLLITKSDLRLLFEHRDHRATTARLCRAVLRHQEAADRLQNMADVLRIALADRSDPARAALLVQYCWRRWLFRRAALADPLYQLTHPAQPSAPTAQSQHAAPVVWAGRLGQEALHGPALLPPPRVAEGSLVGVGEASDGSAGALLAAMARRLKRLEVAQAEQAEASSELKQLLQRVLSTTGASGAVDGAKPSGTPAVSVQGAGSLRGSLLPKKSAGSSPLPLREVAL